MLEKFQKNLWKKVGRNSAAKLLWNFTNKFLPEIAKTTVSIFGTGNFSVFLFLKHKPIANRAIL